MIDFGLMVDAKPSTQTVTVRETAPVIVETVRVAPSQSAAYVMKDDVSWGWGDLRDYVIREIEKRHGPQVRDPKKEVGIFKGFLSRWGDRAPAIARSAFEVHNGMWRNAPISVNRFCSASDPYFAAILAERI